MKISPSCSFYQHFYEQWFAQSSSVCIFWSLLLFLSSSFPLICSFLSVLPPLPLLNPSVCPSVIHFLPSEDDVLTWSRIINHGNIIQSSGCVHTLPLDSPVWLFRVTRSEVRGHAVITGRRPAAVRYRGAGRRSNSCSLKLYSSREIWQSSALLPTHPQVQTGSRPVQPVCCCQSQCGFSMEEVEVFDDSCRKQSGWKLLIPSI